MNLNQQDAPYIPFSKCQIWRQSDYTFAFYGRFFASVRIKGKKKWRDMHFANCISSYACIMVQPKLTFVFLCSPHSFLYYCVRDNFWVALLHGFMEDLVSAVIAEVFNTLSFCLSILQNVRQHWWSVIALSPSTVIHWS